MRTFTFTFFLLLLSAKFCCPAFCLFYLTLLCAKTFNRLQRVAMPDLRSLSDCDYMTRAGRRSRQKEIEVRLVCNTWTFKLNRSLTALAGRQQLGDKSNEMTLQECKLAFFSGVAAPAPTHETSLTHTRTRPKYSARH